MTKQGIKLFISGALLLAATFVSLFLVLNPSMVKANPLFFTENPSATATTSLTYLVTGTTGTTTSKVLDSFKSGVNTGTKDAVLLFQFAASSTNTIYQWRYEYSQGGNGVDCVVTPKQCDWYPLTETILTSTATTTPIQLPSGPYEYAWKFASSSQGALALDGTEGTSTLAVLVPTPTRYVRAVVFLQKGSANGAVWSDWIGKKEER